MSRGPLIRYTPIVKGTPYAICICYSIFPLVLIFNYLREVKIGLRLFYADFTETDGRKRYEGPRNTYCFAQPQGKEYDFFYLGILDDIRRVPSGYQVVRNDSEKFE